MQSLFSDIYWLILIYHLAVLLNTVSNLYLVKVFKVKPYRSKILPKVSVLIPARNEESNIGTLLSQLITQNYGHFEILVLDDNSDDGTYEIINSFVNKYPKRQISLFKGKPLPPDWSGKNWACHQLSQKASGEILIFLDADVQFMKNFITAIVTNIYQSDLDFLSVFPQQINMTLGEKLAVPLINWSFISLYPSLLLKYFKVQGLEVAIGQVLAFKANCYRQIGGHKSIKSIPVEDLALARIVASSGFKSSILRSTGLVKVRMYQSFNSAVRGVSRSLAGSLKSIGILGLLVFPGVVAIFNLIPLLAFDFRNVTYCVILVVIMLQGLVSSYMDKPSFAKVLIHPLNMLTFAYVWILTIYLKLTNQIIWRGRKVNLIK